MKLILSSAGFTTEEIISKCEEFVGKKRDQISFAIINEAYATEHEDNLRWILDDLERIRNNFGGNLEVVNLLALDLETVKERIKQNDVIYVEGGHTDYLMSVFNKTGLAEILPELLKTKVYVGSSAGGMVLCKRVSDETYKTIYGERNSYGISHFMDLADLSIMPHLDSEEFPFRKETIIKAAKDNPGIIYGLRDDSALIIEDDKITTIGSKPYIFNKK